MHRIVAAAALLWAIALSSCGALTPALAQISSSDEMLYARLEDLNAWIRLNSGYTSRRLPKIVIRSPEDMARLHFGDENFRPDLIGWVRAQASSGVIFVPPDVTVLMTAAACDGY